MDRTNRVKHNLCYFHEGEVGIEPAFAYQLQEELWEMEKYANKLAEGLPCLPKDVENLKRANLDLAAENEKLKKIIGKFRCPNDINNDGDCHLCERNGGCLEFNLRWA